MVGEAERRRRERAERAAAHQSARGRREATESARAQVLIDRFVAGALASGRPAEDLTARPWRGRSRYRTDVSGWYLREDRSLGVGRDGGYYLLVVPPRRFGRWRRLHLEASPPPLQVGEGARDGESIALEVLLRRLADPSP